MMSWCSWPVCTRAESRSPGSAEGERLSPRLTPRGGDTDPAALLLGAGGRAALCPTLFRGRFDGFSALGQIPQLAHGVDVVLGARIRGEAAQTGDRAVKELVGHGVDHDRQGLSVGRGEVLELAGEAPLDL